MSIELDHVAVRARDKHRSARFFAEMLGLQASAPVGPWAPVQVSDDLAILFHETEPFAFGHCTFRVDPATFDRILAYVGEHGVEFGSAPGRHKDGQIASEGNAQRVYVRDPDGNSFEFMTPGTTSHVDGG